MFDGLKKYGCLYEMINDARKLKVFKNSENSYFVLSGCETMQSGRWKSTF